MLTLHYTQIHYYNGPTKPNSDIERNRNGIDYKYLLQLWFSSLYPEIDVLTQQILPAIYNDIHDRLDDIETEVWRWFEEEHRHESNEIKLRWNEIWRIQLQQDPVYLLYLSSFNGFFGR